MEKSSLKTKIFRQGGHGNLEYGILLGLAALALIGVYLVFGPDIGELAGSLFRREPPAPVLEVIQTGEHVQIIDTEVIPVRNCGRSEAIVEEVDRTRQFEYRILLDEDYEESVAQVFTERLQLHYGFMDGEQSERKYTLTLSSDPNSGADYTIEWQEIWHEGHILVTWPDGTADSIPYQALTSVEFIFTNISEVECDG